MIGFRGEIQISDYGGASSAPDVREGPAAGRCNGRCGCARYRQSAAAAHSQRVFGIGQFVRRLLRFADGGILARLGARRTRSGGNRHRKDLRPVPGSFVRCVENVASRFGPGCRRADAGACEQTLPVSHDLLGQRLRPSRLFADDAVRQSRRQRLVRREPAAVAVVFGHQGRELLRRASRTGGIDPGQAFVGLPEQVELPFHLVGVAFGRARRPVDQVEGVGRYFACAVRCGLCDDRRRRGGVSVAAGRHRAPQRAERVVDQQGVVHVSARRPDVDRHLLCVDGCDSADGVAEFLVGGYAGSGVVELPRFGYADRAFDVDFAASGRVADFDLRLHVSMI